jgi:ATP-binding cassette subfamily C (CFTR/MRP) protein 4
MLWPREIINITKKRQWQQSFHYDLVEVDTVRKNYSIVAANMEKYGSLRKALFVSYQWLLLKIMFCSLFYVLLNFSTAWLLSKSVAKVKSGADFRERENFVQIIVYFGSISVSVLLGSVMYNFFYCEIGKLSFRVRSAVVLLIFEKMLVCNHLNSSKHQVGHIINYIQTDSSKFEGSVFYLLNFIMLLISMCVGYIYIWKLIGIGIAVMLGVLIMTNFLLFFVFKMNLRIRKKLLKAKDKRVGFLKNVVNSLHYVKVRAWENFYHFKLYFLRENEVIQLKLKAIVFGLMSFFNLFNPSISIISLVFFSIYVKQIFHEIDQFSAFLRSFDLIKLVLISLPVTIAFFIDLSISLNRINDFLNIDEIDHSWINQDQNKNFALAINQGNFVWNAKIQEKEVDKLYKRKNKKKKKKLKKVPIALENDNSAFKANQVSLLSQNQQSLKMHNLKTPDSSRLDSVTSMIDEFELDQALQTVSFKLANVNLAILKGKLVFVIGRTGSGKSSLLYSLLGEMKLDPLNNIPSMIKNGSVGVVTQSPWILSQTVKENITLNLPYDKERMKWAIKMAQFDQDLKLMPEGIETVVGEDGSSVSGGQKTRLALARCFYQKYV